MKWDELETDRLILVAIEEGHAQDIFHCFTSELTRYMYPAPATKIEETLGFIHFSLEEMKKSEGIQLVILSKKDRTFIGCIGLHKLSTGTAEPGLWLRKEVHGQGLGFEAMEALIAWARREIKHEYYIYPVDKRNTGSLRIAEKLGGQFLKEYETQGMAGNELKIIEYKIPG